MACHIVKPGSEKIAAIEKVVYEYFDTYIRYLFVLYSNILYIDGDVTTLLSTLY